MEEERKKKKRRGFLWIALLVAGVLCMVTSAIAYFSDMISDTGTITSGTLDISGAYAFYVNGAAEPAAAVSNLNPGDAIVMKATITNNGNKSAWIRDVVTFEHADAEILPFLTIYEGEFTKEDLKAGGGAVTAALLDIAPGGSAATSNKVINGTGAGAETEAGAGFNYLDSNVYTSAVTVYFSHTATNEAQAKSLGLTVKCQALQFKNNDAAEPDAAAWDTVTAAPFGG